MTVTPLTQAAIPIRTLKIAAQALPLLRIHVLPAFAQFLTPFRALARSGSLLLFLPSSIESLA